MCGRYYISPDGEIRCFIEEANRRQQFIMGQSTVGPGEIYPAYFVPSLAKGRNGNICSFPMKWGYRIYNDFGINARIETAKNKKLFAESWYMRRCVLPCDNYYEWQIHGVERAVKYSIRPAKKGVVYLAGLYRYEPDMKLPKFVVLTKAPAKEICFIHDRMPVIFDESNYRDWLNGRIPDDDIENVAASEMDFLAVS